MTHKNPNKMTWAEWERAEKQDTPKLWRDMTDAEKGALLLAHHEGKVIEFHNGSDPWITLSWDFDWMGQHAYRIKPEPKKPREWWIVDGMIAVSDYEGAISANSVIGGEIIHVREVMGGEE